MNLPGRNMREHSNVLSFEIRFMYNYDENTTAEQACVMEIDKLAKFILTELSNEIGSGNPVNGESAVDVAIRLMKEFKSYDIERLRSIKSFL